MATMSVGTRETKIGTNCFKVAVGGFQRVGGSPTSAREDLKRAIIRQTDFAFTREYRSAADGTVFVLYYSDGWRYDITRGGAPVQISLESSVTTYAAALAIMERHVASYATGKDDGRGVWNRPDNPFPPATTQPTPIPLLIAMTVDDCKDAMVALATHQLDKWRASDSDRFKRDLRYFYSAVGVQELAVSCGFKAPASAILDMFSPEFEREEVHSAS